MKNIDIIKLLPIEAFALLFVKEKIFEGRTFFISLSGELFEDYDVAIRDCVAWLNTNCE